MIERGERAPDVLLETPDGDQIRLGDEFRRGPALVAFFKVDCATSKVTLSRLPRFAESYDGVTLWAISQDDPATTREFLIERAPSLPVLIDAPDLLASSNWGIETVPATFLLAPGGFVLESLVGWDRERFNGLSLRLSSELGAVYRELVPDGEGPAYRPG